jgi:hypothetical protein
MECEAEVPGPALEGRVEEEELEANDVERVSACGVEEVG